jgi:hypothetical protein
MVVCPGCGPTRCIRFASQSEADKCVEKLGAQWNGHCSKQRSTVIERLAGSLEQSDESIPGCAICGDTRENSDGWECLGCGAV